MDWWPHIWACMASFRKSSYQKYIFGVSITTTFFLLSSSFFLFLLSSRYFGYRKSQGCPPLQAWICTWFSNTAKNIRSQAHTGRLIRMAGELWFDYILWELRSLCQLSTRTRCLCNWSSQVSWSWISMERWRCPPERGEWSWSESWSCSLRRIFPDWTSRLSSNHSLSPMASFTSGRVA